MAEVIMPKMGDAMESGTLLRWLKGQGEEVAEGDQLAEIETDKVTLELEAENSGTLHELYASEGQDIPIGEAIAVILAEGEEPPARRESEQQAAEGGESETTTTATQTAEAPAEEAPAERPRETEDPQANGRFRASPIVRRLARENELDLSLIEGSGPGGRIVERDVRAAMERGEAQAQPEAAPASAPEPEAAPQPEAQPEPAAASAPAAAAAPEPTGAPGTDLKEIPRMQRVIGERMQQSKRDSPHFYATVEAEVDELMALRKRLNDSLAEEGVKLSVNDFVMKACAVALGKYPNLNALYTSEGIEQHATVNLAMAVALEAGLITPVIRDASNKPLSAISAEAKDLASRAREGQLKPDEYQGGTFTVSNMGMFGVEDFAAIINPPQAAIVAVSAINRRPAFDEEDNVIARSTMKLTLSADHRVSNGAEGALYMAEVKRILEKPTLLVV